MSKPGIADGSQSLKSWLPQQIIFKELHSPWNLIFPFKYVFFFFFFLLGKHIALKKKRCVFHQYLSKAEKLHVWVMLKDLSWGLSGVLHAHTLVTTATCCLDQNWVQVLLLAQPKHSSSTARTVLHISTRNKFQSLSCSLWTSSQFYCCWLINCWHCCDGSRNSWEKK